MANTYRRRIAFEANAAAMAPAMMAHVFAIGRWSGLVAGGGDYVCLQLPFPVLAWSVQAVTTGTWGLGTAARGRKHWLARGGPMRSSDRDGHGRDISAIIKYNRLNFSDPACQSTQAEAARAACVCGILG